MKKIYLGALTLAICSAGMAQNVQRNLKQIKKDVSVTSNNTTTARPELNDDRATVLWFDNCNSAATWDFTNTSTPALDWSIETSATAIPVADLSPMASTSVGDGYLFISSDAVVGNDDQDNTPVICEVTTNTTIDLTGQPDVVLSFEHNFRWWQETREVRVSGDGGLNWTPYQLSDATGSLIGDQNSGNPELTKINISDVAGNMSDVKIQFSYNDNDYWGWYWAVDDVKISTPEDNDIAVDNSYIGSLGSYGLVLPYYMVPDEQIAPISFSTIITNIGLFDQPNAILTVDVNSGASTLTSATGVASVVGVTDSLFTTADYTPAALGSYTFDMVVTSDILDDYITNNSVATQTVEVTDFIYARDNGVVDNGSFNEGNGFEAGNVFDMFADQTLWAINATIGTSSEGDASGNIEVSAAVYFVEPSDGSYIFMEESDLFIVTADDITNGNEVTIKLNSAQDLVAGSSYVAVIRSLGNGGASNDLVVATAQAAQEQTTAYFDNTDGVWYYTGTTPMVRMNFDPTLGVEELNVVSMSLGQNFPNPSTGTTTINYSLENAENVSIEVTDVTGRVVEVIEVGNVAAGNHSVSVNTSELGAGTYFYTLSNGITKITKTMTIK